MLSTAPALLDFNTNWSLTAKDYVAVTPKTYSATRGWGWSSSVGAVTNNTMGNLLTRDVHRAVDSTFRFDLASGVYDVTPIIGDPSTSTDRVILFLEGKQVASELKTAANQFLRTTYRVQVSDGQLDVRLVDAGGATTRFSIAGLEVRPVDAGPTAWAGSNVTGSEGQALAFSGQATGSGPLSYEWNMGDGTIKSGTLTPTHTYADNGVYTVSLTVTDSLGKKATSTLQATVSNLAPTVTMTAPSTGLAGQSLSFKATASDASLVDQAAGFTYAWKWGDGTTSTGASPTHVYANAGTYTVEVTATDKDGGTSVKAVSAIVISLATSSPVVHIDANWLNARGSGPYYLDAANTTYVLQTDVTVEGTAFIVLNKNVTFDLNGHTVTYGNSAPIVVPNGGFESGTSATDIAGWDVSGAPGAKRVAARAGMWGDWMLRMENISTTQTIVSQPIAIPKANVEYAAVITPKGPSGTTVKLSVVDASSGVVLASANSRDVNRGFSAFIQFVPTTTNSVRLHVEVTPPTDKTATVDLDYAALIRSRDYGVVASPSPWNFPKHLQTSPVTANAKYTQGFSIKGGSVVQGQGRSFSSSPLYAQSLTDLVMDGVTLVASGTDTHHVDAQWATNPTIRNARIVGELDRITDRMRLFAGLRLDSVSGSVLVEKTEMTGSMHTGITLTRKGTVTDPVILRNNSIAHQTLGTDGYAFVLNNLKNFQILNNSIQPTNGRGILFDSFLSGVTEDGLIAGNVIEARERGNLEYDGGAMEATALRIRNYGTGGFRNLTFRDNTFFAETGLGANWAATSMRINFDNSQGVMTDANLRFENNIFRARLNAIDPIYTGARIPRAWGATIATVGAGTGTVFAGNRFESNDISLNFGDNDGWSGLVEDVTFVGNTMARLDSGVALTHRSIVLGDWSNTTRNVRMIDTRFENGATSQIHFLGTKVKDIATGWLVDLRVLNSSGAGVANASITIKDKSGQAVLTGVTDSQGRLTGIRLITQILRQSGTDPKQITTDDLGPFTIEAVSGTKTTSRVATISENTSLDLLI